MTYYKLIKNIGFGKVGVIATADYWLNQHDITQEWLADPYFFRNADATVENISSYIID